MVRLDLATGRSYNYVSTSPGNACMIRWVWDPRKARTNLRDHKVSFELAQPVFGDAEIISRPDRYRNEER